MDREEILKDIQNWLDGIQKYLDKFKDLNINSFQHELKEMNMLNPYFGYKEMTDREFNNGYGVRDIWMAAGANNLRVTAKPHGYMGKAVDYSSSDMNEYQLEGVYNMVKSLHDNRVKEIERTQKNPKLETLLPEIKDWAERHMAIAGSKYKVSLEFGRRQSDGNHPYHALVLEKEGWQIGSIPLRQDSYGKLTCKSQKPLCGETGGIEFTPENWKDIISQTIQEIAGTKINMEREKSPVRNPEIIINRWGEYHITCEVDGRPQGRKPLTKEDRMEIIRCRDISKGFYLGELKYDLANKYFNHEITLAKDRSQSHGRSL